MNIAAEVQNLCACDHLVMKLLILIMIFSKGADCNEPSLREPSKVFHAQNLFVGYLWDYLNVRFGPDQTASIFARLIFSCVKCQALSRETKEALAEKNVRENELVPLMQSVLQVS